MADNSTDADMAATTSHESITDSMDAEITEEQALEMATNLAAEAPMMDINESNGSPVMPPRLIITKMELINFKSYAGTKTIGPFHKRFSSVVGPNGSGKSNVIDAMLFVFGKRAKKLRLNKVSELIHSSDAYTGPNALQYARVNVHFAEITDASTSEDDDSYTIVPSSEIVISRIARRDNSSNYMMNNKNATFKKVSEYLDSKGIDLDNNRFLILQGEVELISMMPPKGKNKDDDGLLEYLEDIIGSNKYVEETEAAAEKVEELTEVRQEKLNRVKAAEKEVAALSGAKSEAMGLVNKDREVRRKKNVYYQINRMHARQEGDRAEVERGEFVTKLEDAKLKLSEADSQLEEIEEGIAGQRAEYEAIHQELLVTKEEYTKFERQEIQMKENIKFEKSTVKKLEGKVIGETQKMEDAEVALAEAEESIPSLEAKIESCAKKREEEDANLEVIHEETRDVTEQLRKELEVKTEQLAPLLQERSVFQNSLDTAEMEVKLLEDGVSRAKTQLENAERELASLDERQAEKKKEMKLFEKELSDGEKRVEVAEGEAKELEAREGVLSKKSAELLTRAEVAKASIQSTQGRSRTVNSILQASKKNGELSKCGVLGRLGDLATIDEKYDVAVSTACGMLDHIVVQTTAGTQKCLEFLRNNNLGRASFVPLEKMKKGAHDRVVETPENAPRLFDLITPANFQIAPALFLAVGNTLVAPDLETATRWAYEYGKRWRVVTLDGKLIESSGTMSGGGKTVSRGKMKLSNGKKGSANIDPLSETTAEDSKKLELEAMLAQEELKKCREKRRQLVDEIRMLTKRIKSLSVKLPQLEMEIAGFDTTREELTKRLPSLREQSTLSDADEKKKDELLEKVEQCKSNMASCVETTSKLEKEVSTLQKNIINAGGSKLKNQQKVCEKAKKDHNDAAKELNAAKSTISTSKKTITKSNRAKGVAEMELEKSKAGLDQMKEDHEKLTADAKELLEAYEAVKVVEAEKRKALEGVSKESDALKQVQTKLKCAEVELLAKIEGFDKQIKDSERKMAHWQKEIQQLCKLEKQEDIDYDLSDDEEEDRDDVTDTGVGESKEDDVMAEDDIEANEPANDAELNAPKKTEKASSCLPTYPDNALEQYSIDSLKNDIAVLEKERDSLAKNANMGAIVEYRKKEADYLSRVSDLDQITSERNEARKTHDDLKRQRLEKFMDGFSQITLKLKEMYQMITLGGDAELELVDSLDPFSEGIVFSVRPPKKSWKNIANLSGGEKTLSSLALVFALHHYKPTPLYVMDEIDAALDFKNVSIVAHYIKERTKNAQFIIISLRNNMFELADRLVGIYKTNNCTKSVTINPKLYSKNGKQSDREAHSMPNTPLLNRTNLSSAPTPVA